MKLSNYKLQIAMANACITVNELSVQSEVSRIALSKIMNGKSNPKPVTIGKIAKALNVKVEDIIEE
jgi:transcriptional regulator with XRE-family HTH domain